MTGGAVLALAVTAAAAAAACVGRPRPSPLSRLRNPVRPERSARAAGWSRRRRLVVALVVLLGAVAVLGGSTGSAVGAVLAAATLVVRHDAEVPGADPDAVPLMVDLLAGCLAAGVAMTDALEAAAEVDDEVGGAVDGAVVRVRCRATAAALRTGAPPAEAWDEWLADGWLAPVARTMLRTSQTGAAVADDLRRTAARLRDRRRADGLRRVRRASVWVVVPLGLCFLPAFVLIAVVPLVAGLLPSLR